MFDLNKLIFLGITAIISVQSYAGEGEGHSHAPGGDMQTIGIVVVILIVAGVAVNFWNKKKK